MPPIDKNASPRKILIAGGGSAGWLTAAFLARTFGTERTGGPAITLIESPDIGTIGVGEGSFPSMRGLIRYLGIDEAEFIRETGATFKQGIRFDNWATCQTANGPTHYFHPFDQPFINDAQLDLTRYWLALDADARPPFASAVTHQTLAADRSLAPKGLRPGPSLNYAYHFDAGRFAALLSRFARFQGVRHLMGRINGVSLSPDGAIASVASPEHGALAADLYIDCTGFRAELIGRALNVPFKPVTDILFTDRAVACQVAYAEPDAPIASYTISTAHAAGWTWDIGLQERRGIGYVYSSAHTSDIEAEDTLQAYLAQTCQQPVTITPRRICFQAGYRTAHWVKNCVAIGLSGGFMEPLEATGLIQVESAVYKLAELFPYSGPIDSAADRFNAHMVKRYETITRFLKLHYCLSRRPEPFWRDNADAGSIPEALQVLLADWRHRPPSRFDFVQDFEAFAHTSYQYILYGMNFQTDNAAIRPMLPRRAEADQLFALIQANTTEAARHLPTHRSFIQSLLASA